MKRVRAVDEAAIRMSPDGIEASLEREPGAEKDREGLLPDADTQSTTLTVTEPKVGEEDLISTKPLSFDPGTERSLLNTKLKDRYRISHQIGSGGFGVVYLAFDEDLPPRKVVVKVLIDRQSDSWTEKKFRTEIQALATLNHPNIVSISDSGSTSDGRPFLVMEYVEGNRLRDLIKPEGMSLPLVADMVRQIGGALHAAHRSGIWHRDLKPENIIVQTLEEGAQRVKVIDFGIATVSEPNGPAEKTSRLAGTIRYMAPEQLRGKPSSASDIYALALITYEMVTGRTPFPAETVLELHAMQAAGVKVPPRKLRPNLPEATERCILKGLRFKAQNRQPGAIVFVRELALGAGEPESEHADLEAGAAEVRGRWWEAARWKAVAIAAALLIVAAVGFAIALPPVPTSVVVFQIADTAKDPALQLSTGLTGELVSRLLKVPGLTVRRYYGRREQTNMDSLPERFYLDGDLQSYGNCVRLTMRLTDTKRAVVVWSKSFDHDFDNPLKLETEVGSEVVEGLESSFFSDGSDSYRVRFAGYRTVQLLGNMFGVRQAPISDTRSPAAYQAYLRGRQLYEERTPASVRSAIESLLRAVEIDPNFALAYAALSDAYRATIDERQAPQEQTIGHSLFYAQKAVRLNPELPEGYAALAGVQQAQWNWEASEHSYKEAIRLAPKSPIAYRRYGGLMLQYGRFDEALRYVKTGLELDPYDYPGRAAYGMCLMLARRYQEAEDDLKSTLTKRDFISAHDILARVYALRGKEAGGREAERYFDLALGEEKSIHALEAKGVAAPEKAQTPISDEVLALIYGMRGDRVSARTVLERMVARPDVDAVSPAVLAEIYGTIGETATAISYLRQAASIKDRGLLYLKVDPLWDPIRNEAGYREILLTMRL
jgi:serine/threonine protein kinase/Tfp pilus assembly protein PilF